MPRLLIAAAIFVHIFFFSNFGSAQSKKFFILDDPYTNPPPPPPPSSKPSVILNIKCSVDGFVILEHKDKTEVSIHVKRFSEIEHKIFREISGWKFIDDKLKQCTYTFDKKFKKPGKNVRDSLVIDVIVSDLDLCLNRVSTFHSITDNTQYVPLPAATFQNHKIEAFEAAIHEINVEQYSLFVSESEKYKEPSFDSTTYISPYTGTISRDKYELNFSFKPTGEKYEEDSTRLAPVVFVNIEDVKLFTEWLNSKSKNYIYRLPTKEEWEYMALGASPSIYRYPWGNLPEDADKKANTGDLSLKSLPGVAQDRIDTKVYDGYMFLWPIDFGAPNKVGLKNIIGNVAEWTSSPVVGNKKNKNSGSTFNIIKGGSFFSPVSNIAIMDENSRKATERYPGVGFRLIRIKKSVF